MSSPSTGCCSDVTHICCFDGSGSWEGEVPTLVSSEGTAHRADLPGVGLYTPVGGLVPRWSTCQRSSSVLPGRRPRDPVFRKLPTLRVRISHWGTGPTLYPSSCSIPKTPVEGSRSFPCLFARVFLAFDICSVQPVPHSAVHQRPGEGKRRRNVKEQLETSIQPQPSTPNKKASDQVQTLG